MSQMKNTRVLISIIGLLLVSNIVLLVLLFGRSNDRAAEPKERKGFSESLKSEVGFNEAQLKEFEAMRTAHRANMKPLFEDLRETKNQFFYRITDTSLIDLKIDSASTIIGRKQAHLDAQVFRYFKRVRALCTPEQQPKFDSLYPGVIQRMTAGPWRDKKEGEKRKERK